MVGGGTAVFAQEASDVELDSPVRAITLRPGDTRVDLDVDLFNSADSRRLVKFTILGEPEGWDVGVWNAFFAFRISELVVEATELTPGQRPRMRVDLPENAEAGDYSFTLLVTSPDGSVEYDRATYTITVEPGIPDDDRAVEVRSTFPVLRGPATSQFGFEIVIKNDTGADASFDLSADARTETNQLLNDWEISFSPSFGEAKLIASLDVQAALTERVDVNVTPAVNQPPGDYFIPVTVGNDEFTDQALLQLTIIGRGELLATTDTGRLSVDATAGDTSNTTFRLVNIGTADLADIRLSADAPPNWTVDFQIDTVESLPLVTPQIDVRASITPPDDAVPGDYEVLLRGAASGSGDSVTLRVTVAQSTIWGWLGIVLVLVVVGGMVGLFVRLGRR